MHMGGEKLENCTIGKSARKVPYGPINLQVAVPRAQTSVVPKADGPVNIVYLLLIAAVSTVEFTDLAILPQERFVPIAFIPSAFCPKSVLS
jgi:hypothetical protein